MTIKKITASVATFLILTIFFFLNVTATAETFDLNGDGKVNVFDAIIMRKDILRMDDTESNYNISNLVSLQNFIADKSKIGTTISENRFDTVSDECNDFISYIFSNYSLKSIQSSSDLREISLWFKGETEEFILDFPINHIGQFKYTVASTTLDSDPEVVYTVECGINDMYAIIAKEK